jgi:putative transposase
MSTQRSSVIECSGSGMVIALGSLNTVFASRKLTPCFVSLIAAFSSSYSNCNDTLRLTSPDGSNHLLSSLAESFPDGDDRFFAGNLSWEIPANRPRMELRARVGSPFRTGGMVFGRFWAYWGRSWVEKFPRVNCGLGLEVPSGVGGWFWGVFGHTGGCHGLSCGKLISSFPMTLWRTYYHFVWATRDRLALITPDRESILYEYIGQKSQFLEVQLHAIGGMPDHIHLIVSIPPKIAIAEFVKRIKGGSSHYLNELNLTKNFAWQREYGVFSLGSQQLDRATGYVNSQKQRHEDRRLIKMLEVTSELPDRQYSQSNNDKTPAPPRE